MTRDEQWLLREKYGGVEGEAFEADRARLAAGEPLAYVIGSIPFLGLTIHLDSRPLIPRPETEWWVEQLIRNSLRAEGISGRRESHSATAREEAIFQQKNTPLSSSGLPEARLRVLDLCAGSGAIGCAILAKVPNAHVSFGEIDPAHKATIEKNIRENNLDASRAEVRIGDLFAPFAGMTFDYIAINPPYIPAKRTLDASVVDFEPHQALFSGTDGLDLTRRIAEELRTYLAPGGTAWIECDSSTIREAEKLFTASLFTTSLHTDQYKVPRLLVVE